MRSIPAYAGVTHRAAGFDGDAAIYPRLRGGDSTGGARTRHPRLTAYAGVTQGVHGRSSTPLEVLRSLLRQAHGRNIRLIISVVKRAGHVQLADARHLPQSLLYRPYKENKPLTAAVHSQAAIMSAARSGASCLLISPVFATKSHPDGKPLGVVRLAALTRLAGSLGMRVYALGGITRAAHIRRLRDTGISGIAGITLLQA